MRQNLAVMMFFLVFCFALVVVAGSTKIIVVVRPREETDGGLDKDIPDVRNHPDSVANHSRASRRATRDPVHAPDNVAPSPPL
jgi:hypothetical protein